MTTRPALIVDAADPTPPYEQLHRQLAELIRSAVLEPGGTGCLRFASWPPTLAWLSAP